MVGRVSLNSSAQNGQPLLPPKKMEGTAKAKQVARELFVPIGRSFYRLGCHFLVPSETPAEVLTQVTQVSEDVITQAKEEGIQAERVKESFKTLLDAELEKFKTADTVPHSDEISKKEMEEQIRKQRDILRDNLSAFSAFQLMLAVCGLKGTSLDLTNLVKLTTLVDPETRSLPSIWKVFTTNCQLSVFQKIKAALIYFVCFKSSLISEIVDALLKGVVKTMKTKLIDRETRTEFFRKFIKNIGDFLEKDVTAAEDFANGKEQGPLIDCRMRVIEAIYKGSLKTLCEQFSETRINQDQPTIPVLRNLRYIFILGWFIRKFESFVNRQIIQRAMKSFILPGALQKGIKKGLKAAGPDMLQFTLTFTRLLTARLKDLKKILKKGGGKPAEPLDGTENLPDVIKDLMRALAIEGINTRAELKAKFEELDKKVGWLSFPQDIVDRLIRSGIERGLNDAGNVFFNFLEKTAESGELFVRILALFSAPFSGEKKTYEKLKKELLEEEIPELSKTADFVFNKIVDDSILKWVADKCNTGKPEEKIKIANKSFETRRVAAKVTLKQLQKICVGIEKKMREGALEGKEIQRDFVGFLEVISVFAKRREVQDELNPLGRFDRDSIWWVLTPQYHKFEKIQLRMVNLYQLQKRYVTAQRQAAAFEVAHNKLMTRQNLSQTNIEELSNLEETFKRIEKNQNIIDSIRSLYHEGPDGGLLQQLLNFHATPQGKLPAYFDHETCKNEIQKHLNQLKGDGSDIESLQLNEDRSQLQSLIGDGANLQDRWGQIEEILQPMYDFHSMLLEKDQKEIGKLLVAGVDFTAEMVKKYTLEIKTLPLDMKKEVLAISKEIRTLLKEIERANLDFPSPIPPSRTTTALGAAVLSGGAALGGGVIAGPPGMVVGAWAGGFLSTVIYPNVENEQKLSATRIAINTAGGIAASSYLLGPLAPLGYVATASKTGRDTIKGLQSVAGGFAFNNVKNTFEKMKRYFRQPRIPHAFATRAMIELSNTEPEE